MHCCKCCSELADCIMPECTDALHCTAWLHYIRMRYGSALNSLTALRYNVRMRCIALYADPRCFASRWATKLIPRATDALALLKVQVQNVECIVYNVKLSAERENQAKCSKCTGAQCSALVELECNGALECSALQLVQNWQFKEGQSNWCLECNVLQSRTGSS